ncbi:TPA: hypothetical protein J1375_004321, partial [Escherichia coli]|nr:hypothetical protein [Escherichia coli]HBA8442362.1 hypothetical protein [Escherichia coli]HBA8451754.1 hypothetical protein [Escherichia coli]HBA8539658.1 hypothetical protein [Escherichia coli]HBA9527466.1 hypothetical protein [Escherichia coli]
AGKTLAGEPDASGGVFLMLRKRKVLIPMWWVVGVCVAATCMACLVLTLVMFCTVLMW